MQWVGFFYYYFIFYFFLFLSPQSSWEISGAAPSTPIPPPRRLPLHPTSHPTGMPWTYITFFFFFELWGFFFEFWVGFFFRLLGFPPPTTPRKQIRTKIQICPTEAEVASPPPTPQSPHPHIFKETPKEPLPSRSQQKGFWRGGYGGELGLINSSPGGGDFNEAAAASEEAQVSGRGGGGVPGLFLPN